MPTLAFSEGPAPDPEFSSAIAVSDHLLAVTRDAYFASDAEAFADRFLLPQQLSTFVGQRDLGTRDDVRALFNGMCAYFAGQGVIDLNRKTLTAEFLAPDLVHANFVSQHVFRDYSQSDEISALSYLKLHEGLWRIAGSHYATTFAPVSRALVQGA